MESESIDIGLSEENVAGSSSLPTPEEIETIENVKSPCLGMNFISLEVAKQFYIDYGKALGFSAVTRSTQKRIIHSNEVSTCLMTCERFGSYKDRDRTMTGEGSSKEAIKKKRNTNTVKCGCLATMRVNRQDSGLWRILCCCCCWMLPTGSGLLQEAKQLARDFEARHERYDLVMLNTMLRAYCKAGEMLRKMDELKISPDWNTFHILIKYFYKEKLYQLAYRTMADMHSKGHQPDESLKMLLET